MNLSWLDEESGAGITIGTLSLRWWSKRLMYWWKLLSMRYWSSIEFLIIFFRNPNLSSCRLFKWYTFDTQHLIIYSKRNNNVYNGVFDKIAQHNFYNNSQLIYTLNLLKKTLLNHKNAFQYTPAFFAPVPLMESIFFVCHFWQLHLFNDIIHARVYKKLEHMENYRKIWIQ